MGSIIFKKVITKKTIAPFIIQTTDKTPAVSFVSEKQLSSEQEKQIIDDYNSGMTRNKIGKKHKITDNQFVLILKKVIKAENNTKQKTVIAHPKFFRFND